MLGLPTVLMGYMSRGLAGLPKEVLQRAQILLNELESQKPTHAMTAQMQLAVKLGSLQMKIPLPAEQAAAVLEKLTA